MDGAAHRFRVVRVTAAVVLASLLTLVVCAATARAEPLSMTFTEARANVGIQLSVSDYDDSLFRAPDTAPFDAQIGPDGSITAGAMDVPDFETFITDPIDAFVTVEFDIGEIIGSFNQATGAHPERHGRRDADGRWKVVHRVDDPGGPGPHHHGDHRRREPVLRRSAHPGTD